MDSKEVRKILVAVDGGEESMYALSWCLKNVVSDNYSDTLILLYAKAPRAVYPALDGTGYLFSSDVIATAEKYSNDLAESIIEKCRRLCQNVCFELWRFANSTRLHVPICNTRVRSEPSILLETVKVEVKVENGDPRDVICEISEKLKPDLLVVGSHGYGFVKRALLGSVSNHCAQNVKCPVLIVKKSQH